MKPVLQTTIEFGDCDEQGIVFYPRYFYWMDCAFHGLVRGYGWNQRTLKSQLGAAGTPLVKATANFLSPATYDDRLVVSAGIARWGKASFELGYKGSVDGRPVFEGWETRVWLASAADGKLKAGAIHDAFRTALGEATADPAR